MESTLSFLLEPALWATLVVAGFGVLVGGFVYLKTPKNDGHFLRHFFYGWAATGLVLGLVPVPLTVVVFGFRSADFAGLLIGVTFVLSLLTYPLGVYLAAKVRPIYPESNTD